MEEGVLPPAETRGAKRGYAETSDAEDLTGVPREPPAAAADEPSSSSSSSSRMVVDHRDDSAEAAGRAVLPAKRSADAEAAGAPESLRPRALPGTSVDMLVCQE